MQVGVVIQLLLAAGDSNRTDACCAGWDFSFLSLLLLVLCFASPRSHIEGGTAAARSQVRLASEGQRGRIPVEASVPPLLGRVSVPPPAAPSCPQLPQLRPTAALNNPGIEGDVWVFAGCSSSPLRQKRQTVPLVPEYVENDLQRSNEAGARQDISIISIIALETIRVGTDSIGLQPDSAK